MDLSKVISQGLCCSIALSLMVFDMWVCHSSSYHLYYSFSQLDQWLPGSIGTIGSVAIAILAWRFPNLIVESALTKAALATLVVSAVFILVGAECGIGVLQVFGECVRTVSSQWFLLLALIPLCALSRFSAFACVTSACLVNFIARMLFPDGFNAVTSSFLFIACPLAVLLFVRSSAQKAILVIRSAPDPAGASILEPESYLSLKHKFFLALFCMGITRGFVGSSDCLASGNTGTEMAVLLLGIIAILLHWTKQVNLDRLTVVSVLLVSFAVLTLCMDRSAMDELGSSAFICGDTLFTIASWTALSVIVKNNRANGVFPFAWAVFLSDVGAFVGQSACFMGTLLSIPMCYLSAMLLMSGFYMTFAHFNGFSIEDTIAGVRPLSKPRIVAVLATSIDSKCTKIAQNYCLTKREAEVMVLLARGRNAAYIQESLVISRNTVKRHVSNIYAKLDVHSQQQLIDLVEQIDAIKSDCSDSV